MYTTAVWLSLMWLLEISEFRQLKRAYKGKFPRWSSLMATSWYNGHYLCYQTSKFIPFLQSCDSWFPWGTSTGKKEAIRVKNKKDQVQSKQCVMLQIVVKIFGEGFYGNHLFVWLWGKTEQILGKESLPFSSLQILYFRNKTAWEVTLWAVSIYQSLKVYYYMVKKNKLPTRLIFIFTSPKPHSASQSRWVLTSTFKENLFANMSWGQSTEDVQWMTSFQFTSSLQIL